MRYVKLTVVDSMEFGLGLMPDIFANKGWDSYVPSFNLGHDLIDHTTKEQGKIWQEFQALGAYLFNVDFGKRISTARARFFAESVWDFLAMDIHSGINSTLRDAEETGEDYQALEMAEMESYKLTKDEKGKFKYLRNLIEGREAKFTDDEDEGYSDESLKYYGMELEVVMSWIMKGFAKAKKRYNGKPQEATKEAINNALKTVQRGDFYEGQVFSLAIDYHNQYATVTEVYGN